MDLDDHIPLKTLLLRIGLRILLLVALILLVALALRPFLNLFLPFILAFLTATLLAPLVKKFTKKLGKARSFWSMLFILLLILAVTGLLIYIGYYLVTQISGLLGDWKDIQAYATDISNAMFNYLEKTIFLPSAEAESYAVSFLEKGLSWLTDMISSWAPNVVVSVGNLASGVASFVISLLFFILGAYFITSDYPALRSRISAWVPDIIRPHVRCIKDAMGSAMFGYLKAQLILSGIVALVTFVSLLIWGQEYAILIALLCGIIDIVPFFGSGVVLVPWAVVALFIGHYGKALFLLILSAALFLFRKLAEPKVVGNQTGLSPLVSLISIYVGMKLGGVVGMILVPIACMIVISLYSVGFFAPTLQDFRMLLTHVISAARLPGEKS